MNPNGEDYFVKRSVGTEKEKSENAKSRTEASPQSKTHRTAVRIEPDNAVGTQKKAPKSDPEAKSTLKTDNECRALSKSGGSRREGMLRPAGRESQDAIQPENVSDKAAARNLRDRFVRIPDSCKAGNVDMVFLVLLIFLLAFGAVMSFSASYAYADKKYGDSYYFVERQLLFTLFGAIAITIVTLFPLKTYKLVTYAVFGLAVILLLLVLVIGSTRGGAKRWLEIPGFGSFQPSELGKTALVMMMSLYLASFADKVESPKFKTSFVYGLLIPASIIGLIGGLVVLERHFSGLIIICCIGLCEMVLGGCKLRYIIPIGVVAAVGIAVLILATGYSSTRISVWLDPWSDPGDEGWQTIQGLYTIASGGIFGVGLGNSRQKYGYVAEPQNDFIFTIICEELGFVGAVTVMLLFLLLIWRGFVIARHSPNRFTYLIVMGLMIKVALQVIFNIAVVTNTIPNTGISLPFFSSGGTSLLVQMAEMGIVLSISRYSHNPK
ncbi:MAG: FtsW/RodA/SpoVE family cell cycle protein [Eubacteriales bacterium]